MLKQRRATKFTHACVLDGSDKRLGFYWHRGINQRRCGVLSYEEEQKANVENGIASSHQENLSSFWPNIDYLLNCHQFVRSLMNSQIHSCAWPRWPHEGLGN
jgi:hypothetical protein